MLGRQKPRQRLLRGGSLRRLLRELRAGLVPQLGSVPAVPTGHAACHRRYRHHRWRQHNRAGPYGTLLAHSLDLHQWLARLPWRLLPDSRANTRAAAAFHPPAGCRHPYHCRAATLWPSPDHVEASLHLSQHVSPCVLRRSRPYSRLASASCSASRLSAASPRCAGPTRSQR